MTYVKTWVGLYMPLSTTVGLSRIRNHGLLGRPLSYAAPNRGSVGRALDHASVMIHPMDMASLIWVACERYRSQTVSVIRIVVSGSSLAPH